MPPFQSGPDAATMQARGRGASASADPGPDSVTRFAALYEETFDAVYRYACVLMGDAGQAEDIAADVYLRAWRQRGSYRREGTALSWLLAITHNCACSVLRKRSAEQADVDLLLRQPDTGAGPEVAVLASVDRRRIREAMASLTPTQQEVIVLRFLAIVPMQRSRRGCSAARTQCGRCNTVRCASCAGDWRGVRARSRRRRARRQLEHNDRSSQ